MTPPTLYLKSHLVNALGNEKWELMMIIWDTLHRVRLRRIKIIPACIAYKQNQYINQSSAFKMEAITVNKQGVGFLQPTDILYLYCIDFQFILDFTITSLPFMELELIGGHVSFPYKVHERRIVLEIYQEKFHLV